MATLRTKETEQKYKEHREKGGLNSCPLCAETAIEQFTYWKVIPNAFPYDRIASVHTMLVPNRHVTEAELTPEEVEEFKQLKSTYLNDNYQFVLEAMHKQKSIPGHFHLHLIVVKNLE